MTVTQAEKTILQEDQFFALRSRAYELADTGRYRDWSHVAYTLLTEGFAPLTIKRLNGDRLAVMMISRICRAQHITVASPTARIRHWLEKSWGGKS